MKHRRSDIEFFILLLYYYRYNYHCVIYGWDTQCEMSESWIEQMGVRHLPLGPDQPFYNVLVEDGTNRYAAQGIYINSYKHYVPASPSCSLQKIYFIVQQKN